MHGFIWDGPAELWRTYPVTYPPPRRKCCFKHTAAFASLLPSMSVPTLSGQRTPQTHTHGALRRRRRAHPRSSVLPAVAAPATGMAVTTESAIPIPASSSESEPPPPATDVLALPPASLCPAGGGAIDSSRDSRSDARRLAPLLPASFCTVYSARASWLPGTGLIAWTLLPELATPVRTIRSPPSVLCCGRSTSATLPFTASSR